MNRKWLHGLVQLMTLFTLTNQASNIFPDPDLILFVIDVEVHEKEDRTTVLNSGNPVLSCTDDDLARAAIQSMSPRTKCGISCFQLLPCTSPADTQFCLYFQPTEGTLSHFDEPTYSLSIICTDDLEQASTASITVNVIPNSPPQFDNPALIESIPANGITSITNDVITTVGVTDVDNDPVIFKITFTPPTSMIYFGQGSGSIRFMQDPLLFCESTISASILAYDSFHTDIGPKVINIPINGNLKPTFNNLDTTIKVPENTAAGTTIYTLGHADAYVGPGGTVMQMTSSSNTALELYELNGFNLRLRVSPDYERSETRSIQLSFQANDGYCFSDVYSLTIEIVDVNEAPQYQPPANRVILYAFEETININTGQEAYDDDQGETLTHTLVDDASGLFRVNPTSGQIFSPNVVDIDDNRLFQNFPLTIRVTDSGGLFDDQNVVIQVRDSNDQAPYFQTSTYTFAATNCSKPGDVIGTLVGQDDDSSFQNNNAFYFGGGSGVTMVTSAGQVVLTTTIYDGNSSTGSATINDTGLYPGPLSGTPAIYTVTCCDPCIITTTPGPTSASNSDDFIVEEELHWFVPTIVGSVFVFALTGYLIYRYCCRRPPGPKPIQVKPMVSPQQRPKPNLPPKPQTPRPAFMTSMPLYVTPEPEEPNPYLFGFLNEKYTEYTDQNKVKKPRDKDKPVQVVHFPDNPVTNLPEISLGPDNATGSSKTTNQNASEDGAPPPPPPTKAWSNPKKKNGKI